MKFTILQLVSPGKGGDETVYRKYVFAPLRWIDEVILNHYTEVWTDDVEEQDKDWKTLENLFTTFNINHPENYHGHSLSVSDIVKLGDKYYFCDSIGWKEITFNDKGIYKVTK